MPSLIPMAMTLDLKHAPTVPCDDRPPSTKSATSPIVYLLVLQHGKNAVSPSKSFDKNSVFDLFLSSQLFRLRAFDFQNFKITLFNYCFSTLTLGTDHVRVSNLR